MDKQNYYETHKERFRYLDEQAQKYIKQEFDYLDSLDLTSIVEEATRMHVDVNWIMKAIEDTYGENYEETFIFNYIDSSNFMDYLTEKYDCVRRSYSIYYVDKK